MRAPRYIALIRPSLDAARGLADDFARRVLQRADLDLVFENNGVSIASTCAPIDLDGKGIILGSAFSRQSIGAVTTFDRTESAGIVASQGRRLIEHYWGPFIAVIAPRGRSGVSIVRAVLGELPCYIVRRPDATVVASDIELLTAFGLFDAAIAWDMVVHHLATRDLRGPQTCLCDLNELPGGQRLDIAGNAVTTHELWSPWTFTRRDQWLDQADEAAAAVRLATMNCIGNRAAPYDKVALLLSGGLDSSIVAAGLVAAGVEVAALTLVTRDAIGDERRHAARVADALSISLAKGYRDATRIDLTRSAAHRLPRPTTRLFLQESRRLALAHANAMGAQAVFNGGGGDNVFCSLQSAGPVADRLRVSGPFPQAFRTAHEMSRIAQASVPAVLADAAKRAWFGKPAFRPFRDTSMLTPAAAAIVAPVDRHPWLVVPRNALPGTAAHVRLITFCQSYVEGLDLQEPVPTIAPLISQPLVETCLRVPSWLWCSGGVNRAVARRAFAPDLPAETISRRSKGTPDSFSAEIFEMHRASICEMLADGLLIQQGLIDRAAVLDVLAGSSFTRGDSFRRILQFVDVEAWAQSMSGHGSKFT